MGQSILNEPAILLLIFRQLQQLDLLLIQRVCRTWRTIIKTDKRLQSKLFLVPDHFCSDGDDPPMLNPLLHEKFPKFFTDVSMADGYLWGEDISGPWYRMLRKWFETSYNWERLARYMHPEASWRKMIPSRPAPTELQVQIRRNGRREIAWLHFDNTDHSQAEATARGASRSKLRWLTFGLVYDLMEGAWFQGSPGYVHELRCSYWEIDQQPDAALWNQWAIPGWLQGIRVTESLLKATMPGPGRVLLRLNIHDRPRDKRRIIHDQRHAKKYPKLRALFSTSKHQSRPPQRLATEAFNFPDAASFTTVPWDIHWAYEVIEDRPPRPTIRKRMSRWYADYIFSPLIGIVCCASVLCGPCCGCSLDAGPDPPLCWKFW